MINTETKVRGQKVATAKNPDPNSNTSKKRIARGLTIGRETYLNGRKHKRAQKYLLGSCVDGDYLAPGKSQIRKFTGLLYHGRGANNY